MSTQCRGNEYCGYFWGIGYGKQLFSTDIESWDNRTIHEQHVYLCFGQKNDSVYVVLVAIYLYLF